MQPKCKLLVCDGQERAALAVVRSLGRAGHTVVVASYAPSPLAAASRFAAGTVPVRDPLTDPSGFCDSVREAVFRLAPDFVIPASEQSALGLGALAGQFPIIGPDLPRLLKVSNKLRVLDAASQLGFSVPRQLVLSSPGESLGAVLREAPYPAVVKSSVSVSEGRRWRASYAAGPHELEAVLRALPAAAYPLLIQERIVGAGEGMSLMLSGGRLVAAFAHRRLREWPPSGGHSVYCESIALDPDLLGQSLELLRHFDWEGPAMVEYKRDRRSGAPVLMEVNGRLWGSLQLAIDAGVDFPGLMLRQALGEVLPASPPAYQVGRRLRVFWGDLDHLAVRLLRSPVSLNLGPRVPGRIRVIAGFLRPHLRSAWDTLRWRDPAPFGRAGADWWRGHFSVAASGGANKGRPPVLLLGSGVTAIGALRALSRQGLEVYHLGRADPILRRSRHYRALPQAASLPDPAAGLSAALRSLRLERAVLLPCSDATVLQVAGIDPDLRDKFPSFIAAEDILETFIDKERFSSLTRLAGVGHPPTWPLACAADLDAVPDSAFAHGFLKPRDSQAFFARYRVKAFWVSSRAAAHERFAQLEKAGFEMQFQEYVPGPPTAHLFLDGFADATSRVRTLLARRRIRMYPEDFGNSTAMETVALDDVRPAVDAVERLVAISGFRGIFSVEFKRDANSGEYQVLEMNVRPWWYVGFAARAGVDVCDWYVRAALGEREPRSRSYRVGARCVYPYYDLSAVAALRSRGEAKWLDFLRGLWGASQPLWAWSDPFPALAEALRMTRSWMTPRRWKA